MIEHEFELSQIHQENECVASREKKHGLLDNPLFVDNLPMKTCIDSGFPIAVVDYRRS